MVSCILNFKADAQLNDAQTAIEKLNLYDPNWRDGFPLSVNDNQTVGLIERLIKDCIYSSSTNKNTFTLSTEILSIRTVDNGNFF